MRTFPLALSGLTAVALIGAACSDSSTALNTDQTRVRAAYEGLTGFVDDDFGDTGAVGTSAASPAFDSYGVQDTAIAPLFWGRVRVVRGGPRPVVSLNIVVQGDSAWVTRGVSFQGIFLADTSVDGTFNPTSKPLAESVQQRGVFVRDAAAPHGWRAVALTLLDWQPTAPDRRTVQVERVAVYRNDTLQFEVENPDSLIAVDAHVPLLHQGDTVRVEAHVANTTGGSFSPSTFAFLHVRHADPTGIRWRRIRMVDDGNGDFSREWIVRFTGRDRFVVDALDAATLQLGTADNYRANEWGIPFRVE